MPFNQTIYARLLNRFQLPYAHSYVPVQLKVNQNLEPVITASSTNLNFYLDVNNNVVQAVNLSTVFPGNGLNYAWLTNNLNLGGNNNSANFSVNTFTGLIVTRDFKLQIINNNNNSCSGLSNTITVNQICVPPPSGNALQTYTSGQTLYNLVVSGTDINWYSTSIPSPATLLPYSTLLTNGTFYYATKTIGGAQSIGVYGVTAVLSNLANEDFKFIDLKFSPNPVQDFLNIQSQEIIKNISLSNILGKEVFKQKFNNLEMKIDLSNLVSGNYFIKIESDNKQMVSKIIKN